MRSEKQNHRDVDDAAQQAKEPYSTPRLVVYGDIDRLTQGFDQGNEDLDLTGNVTSTTI